MKKSKAMEHPEVAEIKNICEITPKTKSTKSVCEKVNKSNQLKENPKK